MPAAAAAGGGLAPQQRAGPAPRPAGPLPLSSAAAGTLALPSVVQTEPVDSASLARRRHAGCCSRTPAELSGPAALLSFP